MNLLVSAATEAEIEPLLNYFQSPLFDVLITGVGMVSTAYQMGRQLGMKTYDGALNVGIAGAFDLGLKIGDTVQVIEETFSELGAEDGDSFLTLAEMELEGHDRAVNSLPLSCDRLDELPKVSGVTVNTVHGNIGSIGSTVNRLDPQVESMEGGAFLLACGLAGVPCAEVRAISNRVEQRNRENWNIPLAIERLNQVTISIIEELNRA